MNQILSIFLMAISICPLFAQTEKPYDLIPYRKDTLWGFADTSKNIIIIPQFDEVKFFDDVIAGVRKGNKWAFINKQGNAVTAYKYDNVGDFREGIAQIGINGKFGYINTKGKEIVVPQYKFAEEFSEGLGIVRDSVNGKIMSGAVDKTGKLVIPRNYDIVTSRFSSGFAAIREHERLYFIDKTGKKLQIPENVELHQEFSEGIAPVKIAVYKNLGKRIDTIYYLGLINTSGKIITDSINAQGYRLKLDGDYTLALNFYNGFAVIQHKYMDNHYLYGAFENYEIAYLDKTGKLSLWYNSGRAFGKDGLTIVTNKGTSSSVIIDKTFTAKATVPYITDAGVFSEGVMRVKTEKGFWNYINENGKFVLDKSYIEVSDFLKGIAVVKSDGRQGCINKRGVQFWE